MKHKVMVYVTRGNSVLVLSHPDHPEVGLQVPGGSVEPGETPLEAAHREVREETGLDDLETIGVLGSGQWQLAPFVDRTEHRTYVHLRASSAPDGPWYHDERHGAATGPGTRFQLFWEPLDGSDLGLVAGHGARLFELTPGASPHHRRRALHEMLPDIVALRRRRVVQIAAAVEAAGARLSLDADAVACNPVQYAALDHFYFALRRAARAGDSPRFGQLVERWPPDWLEPVHVVLTEDCEQVDDDAFESPLFIAPSRSGGRSDSWRAELLATQDRLRGHGWGDVLSTLGVVIGARVRTGAEETESYTVTALRGTVVVDRPCEPFRLAELVLHEASHVWLNDALDALGESLATRQLMLYSPWKQSDRPAYGIVHGAWAFAHMIQWFALGATSLGLTPWERRYAEERLRVEVPTLRQALPQLCRALEEVRSARLRGLILDEVNRAIQPGAPISETVENAESSGRVLSLTARSRQ